MKIRKHQIPQNRKIRMYIRIVCTYNYNMCRFHIIANIYIFDVCILCVCVRVCVCVCVCVCVYTKMVVGRRHGRRSSVQQTIPQLISLLNIVC